SERLEGWRCHILERAGEPLYKPSWKWKLINWENRFVLWRIERLQANTCRLAAELFYRAVVEKREVAIERYDHNRSLTPLQENEAHELLEKVQAASRVWLFVFSPNDLLSMENDIVARLQ